MEPGRTIMRMVTLAHSRLNKPVNMASRTVRSFDGLPLELLQEFLLARGRTKAASSPAATARA
ncbi:hypothetical protein STENM327S_02923 [Streptomyces tendae]